MCWNPYFYSVFYINCFSKNKLGQKIDFGNPQTWPKSWLHSIYIYKEQGIVLEPQPPQKYDQKLLIFPCFLSANLAMIFCQIFVHSFFLVCEGLGFLAYFWRTTKVIQWIFSSRKSSGKRELFEELRAKVVLFAKCICFDRGWAFSK